MKKIAIFLTMTIFFTLFGLLGITSQAETISNTEVGVKYQTNVQSSGWGELVNNGQIAGTTGQALRLEAIKIILDNPQPNMKVKYQAHVQNIGWQNPVYDGDISGSVGQDLRVEAVKISLEGAPAGYHILYQAHVQGIGWQNWVQDGDVSGTTGQSLRVEALRIKIIVGTIQPQYQTHIQDIGWQPIVNSEQIAGTTGQSLRVEGIKIVFENPLPGTSIKYQTHIQNIGWQNWVRDGVLSGTTGQSLRIEALKIVLEGLPVGYSIHYQAHVQNIGWQNWVHDGEVSGTTGKGLRIEAIRVKIVNIQDEIYPIKGKTVVLDPGHGGFDSGASSSGVNEKDINLQVALKLKEKLESSGVNVVITRDNDYFVDLYDRPAIVIKNVLQREKVKCINSGDTSKGNEMDRLLELTQQVLDNKYNSSATRENVGIYKANLVNNNYIASDDLKEVFAIEKTYEDTIFISIHANATSSSSPSGSQIYYKDNGDGKYYDQYDVDSRLKLSTCLFSELTKSLELGTTSAGVYEDNFAVLRESNTASALIELGFMTNSSDLAVLINPDKQNIAAQGIYNGILSYFKK